MLKNMTIRASVNLFLQLYKDKRFTYLDYYPFVHCKASNPLLVQAIGASCQYM